MKHAQRRCDEWLWRSIYSVISVIIVALVLALGVTKRVQQAHRSLGVNTSTPGFRVTGHGVHFQGCVCADVFSTGSTLDNVTPIA